MVEKPSGCLSALVLGTALVELQLLRRASARWMRQLQALSGPL